MAIVVKISLFYIGKFLFFTSLFHQIHSFAQMKEDPIIYSYEPPPVLHSFPIVIVIGGSYVHTNGPESIFDLFQKFYHRAKTSGFAVAALERRGVASHGKVNKKKFHQFNTPAQRLIDHIGFIDYLKKHPPKGWNGNLFIVGGSEGGPIAIKLASARTVLGCATIVGCGDQTFKEYIWDVISSILSKPWWKSSFIRWWCRLPRNRKEYEARCNLMKENPDPKKMWFGQTFLYWSDALDQSEKENVLSLRCPLLVISGSKDIEAPSTKRLVKIAENKGIEITHYCIQDMGHNALNPKWKVIEKTMSFLSNLEENTKSIAHKVQPQ